MSLSLLTLSNEIFLSIFEILEGDVHGLVNVDLHSLRRTCKTMKDFYHGFMIGSYHLVRLLYYEEREDDDWDFFIDHGTIMIRYNNKNFIPEWDVLKRIVHIRNEGNMYLMKRENVSISFIHDQHDRSYSIFDNDKSIMIPLEKIEDIKDTFKDKSIKISDCYLSYGSSYYGYSLKRKVTYVLSKDLIPNEFQKYTEKNIRKEIIFNDNKFHILEDMKKNTYSFDKKIFVLRLVFERQFLSCVTIYPYNIFPSIRKLLILNKNCFRTIMNMLSFFSIFEEIRDEKKRFYLEIEGNKKEINEDRYRNIKSVFYNWSILHEIKTDIEEKYDISYFPEYDNNSKGNFLVSRKSYLVLSIDYEKNFDRFSYMIRNINNNRIFEVYHVKTGRKFVIDKERGTRSLSLWNLGKLEYDWHHCHDLSYHFTEFIMKKLLLIRSLRKNERFKEKINEIYDSYFD